MREIRLAGDQAFGAVDPQTERESSRSGQIFAIKLDMPRVNTPMAIRTKGDAVARMVDATVFARNDPVYVKRRRVALFTESTSTRKISKSDLVHVVREE